MVNVCTFYHIHTKSRTRTKQNRTGSKASNPSAFVAKTSKNSHRFLGTLCVPGSQPDGWKRLVWIRGGAGKAAWRRRVQWEAPNPSCVPWPWPWPWPWGWSLSPQWEAVWPPTVLCKWKPRTYFRVCEQENWKKGMRIRTSSWLFIAAQFGTAQSPSADDAVTRCALSHKGISFSLKEEWSAGTSLVVQWLRLHSQCRAPGFDPWSGN